jgi:hypothetical protein
MNGAIKMAHLEMAMKNSKGEVLATWTEQLSDHNNDSMTQDEAKKILAMLSGDALDHVLELMEGQIPQEETF